MGAFDDLIPAVEDRPQGPPQGHFDDLLPQPVDAKSFFADLIPKPDPGTIGPSTRGPIRRGLSYISRKLEPITPKNRGFPMLEAADIAAGRFETLLPGVDPETGRSIRSQATAEENAAAPTWAKIAAGGERGVATVAEALPPFLIAGAAQSGLAVPLLQRGISAAFAADMVRGLPDQTKSFIQAVNKDDVQGAVESFVGGTLGAYFTYKAATHAIGKTPVPRVDAVGNPVIDPKTGKQIVDFLGIAQESPAIRKLLTRKITEEISPQQMRDIYLRANQGKATPAEEELVRFVNQAIESPGEAIRKGVAVTEEIPRLNNQWVNDYLGLIEGGKTVRLLDGKPVVVPAAQAESSEQRLIGGPNAPTQQSSMAETGRNQAESVPPVPSGASGAVQEPARAPEAQAPGGNVAPAAQPDAQSVQPNVPPVVAEPTMAFARAVISMSPAEFFAKAKSFNSVNFALGANATPEDAKELEALRDQAVARFKKAMADYQANPTPEKQNEIGILSSMPQFYNEALTAYKQSKGGVESGKEQKEGQGRQDVLKPTEATGGKPPVAPSKKPKPTVTKWGKKVGDKYNEGLPEKVIAVDDKTSGMLNPEYTVSEFSELLSDTEVELRKRDMTPDEISEHQARLAKENQLRKELGLPEISIPPTASARHGLPAKEAGPTPGAGSKPSPKPKGSSLKKPQKPAVEKSVWTKIGVNHLGHDVFEDQNKIRSYVNAQGIRVTQPVQIIPTRSGIQTAPGETGPDFTPVETKPAKIETVAPKTETKAPEGGTKTATDENLTALSDDDFDALMDEASKPEAKKPEPTKGPTVPKKASGPTGSSLRKPKPISEPKTQPEKLTDAAKAIKDALDEAAKGLDELFGGGKHVGSGPSFDEETYRKAKPHFDQAWENAKRGGGSILDFLREIIKRWGEKVKPYLRRWREDLAKGTTNETSSGSNVVGGTRPPKGTMAGEAGGTPENQPTEGASGSGGKSDVGDQGETPEEAQSGGGGRGGAAGVRGSAKPGLRPGQTGETPAAGGEGTGAVPPKVGAGKPKTLDPNSENHVIKPGAEVAPKGAITKLRANIDALMLLRELEASNRNATPEEKDRLASYTGWGSLSQVFDEAKARRMEQGWNRDEKWEEKWGKYYTQLKQLLTDEEWRAAARSTQYAHFTSVAVIKPMWDAVQRLGFFSGKVLEPAVGVGHFFGLAPETVREDSKFIGIDQDAISARIATKLYPQAKIFGKSFGDVALPPNSVDVALTNVPFSDRIIKDANYPLGLNLHNWYIAKMLDAVKPGGLVVTITSGHTMDSQSAMRKYLASRSELVGAIRLPNTAFKENAGTEVTTDILFLRKPMTPTPQIGEAWIDLKPIKTYDGKTVQVNEYFANHPEMIAGRPSLEGTMHAGKEEYATLPFEDKPLAQTLKEAVERLPRDVFERTSSQFVDFEGLGKAEGKRDKSLVLNEGALAFVNGNRFTDPTTVSDEFRSPLKVKQAVRYVALTESYRKLIGMQNDPEATTEAVEAERKNLNTVYDAYVKHYGPLNSRVSDYLSFEASYYLALGLEKENITIDPKTEKASKSYIKADVFSKRTQMPTVEPQSAASISDAVPIALSFRGRLDVEYMGKLLGVKPEEAERQLLESGGAFKNPETGLLETPDAYLSGNVRKKLAQAKSAAAEDAAYKTNVEALEKVQPPVKPFRKIRAFIGSTWIPPQLMTEFARSIFQSNRGGIQYNETSDMWIVGGFSQTPQVIQTYGTGRRDGEDILAAILNQKTLKVYDEIKDGDSTRRVLNEVETQKVAARADKLQSEFQAWLRKNEPAQQAIEKAFNEAANNYVERKYEIARLDLPGASHEISFRANQRNAVWRFVQELHGLVGHTVGAGKTMIYIATAMEARRLGLAKKPMIAVLNSTLGQFAASFRKLYPTANVLVGTEKDFETSRRKQFMARIASGDYDAIIIPHSQFNMLPDDPAFETQMTNELLDELRAALAEAQQAAGDDKRNPTVKQIEKQIEKLEQRIAELANRHTDELMTFQDLGVDLLIVDEAHEFKKPPFVTKRDRIAGLSVDTSKRAFSLFLKARYIQSRRQGKGVILGTGTPVTNTLGEAWHMLNIASPHILRDYKVDTFDRFLSTFTLISQEFDVNAVGTLIVRDKLSRFVNLPQLVKMIRSSWDIITQDDLRPILEAQGELYPKLKGGKVAAVVVPRTAAVKRFADFLMEVYTAYKQLDGAHKRQFNYIPVMAFLAGKAAALDIRLVDRTAADDPGSKLNAVVADAFKIWSETKEVKLQDRVAGKEITAPLTQAIFIDQMNPFTNGVATLRTFAAGTGVEYNASGDQPEEPAEDLFLYNDIKKKLIKLGVPESQILIVNEHDTKKPEAALMFDRINRGEIRIVIGSTAKMGVGVNMQRLMYKLHHVDVPWFPALLEQRNGRIERPGNLNPEIEMAYYGMEKTADVGLYAKNESKAKWAQQILSGRVSAEESEDPMSAMILTMQEQMAQLSGDPLLFEKVQLESRIRTLRMQREAFEDDQYNKKSSKKSLGEEIVRNQESIATNTPLLADVSKRLASVLVEEGKTPVYDATIARMKYTTRKDVLAAMESVINQHRSALIRNAEDKAYKVGARGYFDIGSDDRLTVGTINGLVVRAGWTLSQQLQNDEHGKAALVKTASVDSIWFLLDNGKDILSMTRLPSGYPQTADGALRSMNEIPARLKSEIDTSNAFIERANKEIEEINRLLTAKFAGEQELAEAEERYRQLREMAATGNTPQAAKLADELFAIQNSAAPLLIRLRRSLDAAEKQVAKLSEEADPTSRDDDQALVAAEERVKQIVRRLNIVEKARLEGEFSGDAELLGYGLTPSTRPGIRYSRSETVEQPVTQPEAESAVRELMGDIPDNVRFINDPTAPRGEIVMIPGRRGEIELNLAKLGSSGSVKDTVLEELVHGVQNNRANNTPEVNSALDAIDSLVTEVDRQRKSEAGYNPDETQEEAANERARRIFEDADKANIFVRAWRAIVKAFKDLFGIKLSEAENARVAAKAIITEALKNKPTAGSGRRGAEPTAAELRKQRRERAIETGVEEKWIPTQVGGTTDYVRGREQITPLSTSESLIHARNIFNEAGIEVTRDQDAGGWRIVDRGYDQSAAGRLLADILKREIRNKNEPGKAGDLLASLLNSVVYNFKAGSMANFDTPTRQELYSIAQSDRSARGLALGALAGFGEDLQFVAQNVDVVLNRIWSDRYGGEALTHLLDRVVNNFRGYFTNAEIAAALKENRDAEQFISRLIALNRKDEGGRVYRRVQALLKPKQAKTLAKLEADARIEEAVNEILAQASRQGIEPRPTPGKPLPALHKLLLLVSDKNAAAIDRLIANAVSNAERNAGIAAQLKAATSPEELEEWQQRFAEGEDPSAEMVEEGLDFPQFSHWRDIRDNLLDYSPITLKLVQDVVRGSFKGTVRGKPVQKQDVRLDLNLLAKSPEQAVAKALDEYLTIVQANMDLEGATPETQARIEAMLRQEVESQLEAARKRFRSKMFTAPLKPGEKLSDEQRMAQLINAGLFRDENLNIPEMVERAARKSQFQRLNPSVAELIKQVFATPFYRQQDLATEFAAQMVRRFGVPEEQADKAAELFAKAFASRFAVAREKAAKAARETITPQEMQSLGMKKSVWRRIEQAVNSGLFDTGSVLREIAAEHHWKAPTDEQVAKMKQWSEEEQRLRELTPEQRARIGDDPAKLELARLEKEKVFEERRTALKKKIEAEWARITRPLALPGLSLESYAAMWEHRKNNAAALNELASANILLKAGFIPRQFISVLTQGAIHTPTRAMAHALINHAMGAVKGAPTSLLDDIQIALRDSYKVRLASLHSALYATRAAFLGRGEARNVDRLMSSIGAIERIVRKADEAAAAGRPGEAMMYRLMSLIRLGYRVAQAFDNLHGLPAEYQEMVLQVENGLRQLGMNRAQIEANKHRVFGTMEADWVRAIDQARIWFESEGITPTSAELHESAWILVKAWQYERIRDLGLPADDFQERNRLLRSTVGWNERETRGLGGLVGSTIGGISQAGESMGIPLMVGRFGNAIAISINRSLMFTPASGLSNAFGPGTSAWHTTEADRLQRKFEMGIGSLAGLAAFLAVLVGAVVVRLSMPRDPEERALWEKQGIKPNTVEFHLGNGSFIPFSLNTGPMAPLAPYFAAGGALHDLAVSREKAQAKLNSEAAKRGVAPGKINPISIGDQLAVAAAAAQGVIMGGRTAAGLLTSVTDYGVPNSQKLIASQLSPLVPGLPALQEVSRMAGVTLDAKMATVWDFMLPLPTSQARKVNLLGDPAGTPNDLQRIIQVLTAGTYPGIVNTTEATEAAAYGTLYESGYRPPSIDPNKGYAIGGEYRPLSPAELANYTVKRGQYLKAELMNAGPTADPKIAAAAYQRANERALSEIGVEAARPVARAVTASPLPLARRPRGYRGSSLRRRRPSLGFSKGPSLRLRRTGLRLPSTRIRTGRGGSLRRPKLSAFR